MVLELQVYNQKTIDTVSEDLKAIIHSLDIYYQPEYLVCDAEMQGGEFEIALATDNEHYWIYPYILLPIENTPYFDIASPYGYAGPITNHDDFGRNAERLFVETIRKRQNIVTEFVRYHYLYNRNYSFDLNIKNVLNRNVVVLDLSEDNDIWNSQFSSTNRNLVRKLEKEGYNWRVKEFGTEDIKDFNKAYQANMAYTKANEFYFFDVAFYQHLIDQLGSRIRIAFVEKDGIVFASALFFVSSDIVTYYLSARNLDYPKVPGSNLLLSKMSLWAKENKMRIINFGGGLSLDDSDFLFKFKKNFSKTIIPFFIGKRIHQNEIYDKLKDLYIQKYGMEAYKNRQQILQFYR